MSDDVDPATARAGSAFAARRKELRLSQRELDRMKVISTSSLIAFEKGRRWPRAEMLVRLEEAVRWPAGALAAIRAGGPAPGDCPAGPAPAVGSPLVDIVDAALSAVGAAADGLPDHHAATFPDAIASLLADIRRLEQTAETALRSASGNPAEAAALSRIRLAFDDMMLRAASAPRATVGQRLYACRSKAGLSEAETAGALHIPAQALAAIEAGTQPDDDLVARIDDLIDQLSG